MGLLENHFLRARVLVSSDVRTAIAFCCTALSVRPSSRAVPRRAPFYSGLMPRDGAIIFGDLIGKLGVLRIDCAIQVFLLRRNQLTRDK